jgi:putative transcriptional regulator
MNQDVEIELCVKEVMDNKGVSISELSRMADIKYDIVKRYYNGEITRYDSEILKKICVYLECDINDLIKIKQKI